MNKFNIVNTRPFSLSDAKAGAPYCQRNGLAARIGIWDGRRRNYPLVGEVEYSGGVYGEVSWTSSGIFSDGGSSEERDLVMLPLGFCEGKPVFVGDELREDSLSEPASTIIAQPGSRNFEDYYWPRTAPVMPAYKYTGNPIQDRCEAYITNQRDEIEAYWKALDEFNGVKA